MPRSAQDLAAALPDLARWVETRALLLSGRATIMGGTTTAKLPSSWTTTGRLARSSGGSTRCFYATRLPGGSPAHFELLVQMDAIRAAHDVLAGWRIASAMVHTLPSPFPAGQPAGTSSCPRRPGTRWIICRNPDEAERDAAARDTAISRITVELDRITTDRARAREQARARCAASATVSAAAQKSEVGQREQRMGQHVGARPTVCPGALSAGRCPVCPRVWPWSSRGSVAVRFSCAVEPNRTWPIRRRRGRRADLARTITSARSVLIAAEWACSRIRVTGVTGVSIAGSRQPRRPLCRARRPAVPGRGSRPVPRCARAGCPSTAG